VGYKIISTRYKLLVYPLGCLNPMGRIADLVYNDKLTYRSIKLISQSCKCRTTFYKVLINFYLQLDVWGCWINQYLILFNISFGPFDLIAILQCFKQTTVFNTPKPKKIINLAFSFYLQQKKDFSLFQLINDILFLKSI